MAYEKERNDFIHQEIDFLVKENKALKEEIREITLKSDLPLTCSNTSCGLEDPTLVSDGNASISFKRNYSEKKSDLRPFIIDCLFDHPARVNFRNDDIARFKTNTSAKDDSKRLVGEVAFQLDRRILLYVFSPRKRLYGFTMRNIENKIEECCTDFETDKVQSQLREKLELRYEKLLEFLQSQSGYNRLYHPIFSETVVNSFGVVRSKARQNSFTNYEKLRSIISKCIDPKFVSDAFVLLESLVALTKIDGKPLFT